MTHKTPTRHIDDALHIGTFDHGSMAAHLLKRARGYTVGDGIAKEVRAGDWLRQAYADQMHQVVLDYLELRRTEEDLEKATLWRNLKLALVDQGYEDAAQALAASA